MIAQGREKRVEAQRRCRHAEYGPGRRPAPGGRARASGAAMEDRWPGGCRRCHRHRHRRRMRPAPAPRQSQPRRRISEIVALSDPHRSIGWRSPRRSADMLMAYLHRCVRGEVAPTAISPHLLLASARTHLLLLPAPAGAGPLQLLTGLEKVLPIRLGRGATPAGSRGCSIQQATRPSGITCEKLQSP